MAVERQVISLSLAPGNPDAVRVLEALDAEQVPRRQRSAVLLAWLAAYLDGRAREPTPQEDTSWMDDADDAMDLF